MAEITYLCEVGKPQELSILDNGVPIDLSAYVASNQDARFATFANGVITPVAAGSTILDFESADAKFSVLVIVEEPKVLAARRNHAFTAATTKYDNVAQIPDREVAIPTAPSDVAAAPGSAAVTVMTIRNDGSVNEDIALAYEVPLGWTVKFFKDTDSNGQLDELVDTESGTLLSVAPGTVQPVLVKVTPAANASAGDFEVKVRAHSRMNAAAFAAVPFRVNTAAAPTTAAPTTAAPRILSLMATPVSGPTWDGSLSKYRYTVRLGSDVVFASGDRIAVTVGGVEVGSRFIDQYTGAGSNNADLDVYLEPGSRDLVGALTPAVGDAVTASAVTYVVPAAPTEAPTTAAPVYVLVSGNNLVSDDAYNRIANLSDGNTSTPWSSETSFADKWFGKELIDQEAVFNKVRAFVHADGTVSGGPQIKDYEILGRDAAGQWVTVATGTLANTGPDVNQWHDIEFANSTYYRALRVRILSKYYPSNTTVWVYEAEFYASSVQSTTAPTTAAPTTAAETTAAPTTAAPTTADTTPPSTPTNFQAMPEGNGIRLIWTASTDSGSGVVGYVLRRLGGGGDPVTNNLSNVTEYLDSPLNSGATYEYYLSAVDGSGNQSGEVYASAMTNMIMG